MTERERREAELNPDMASSINTTTSTNLRSEILEKRERGFFWQNSTL